MATQSGAENPPVIESPRFENRNTAVQRNPLAYLPVQAELRSTPYEFEFFQAVRLLERMLPERAPVGRFEKLNREVVRFSAHASFPFPASQIQGIEWKDAGPPLMVVNFMGLTGPAGVLPLYYTELMVERIRSKDRAMAAFLDMFNHRMISLFYQAWEKYRFQIAYERGERDRFSHHLMDLVGIGTPHLHRRLSVRDDSLLFYAGLISLHTRSAVALERVLADYFEVQVEVEQFTGSWHRLAQSDLCEFDRASTVSEQLGGGAIVGDEIYDQQSGIRIKIGPLKLSQYLNFLPSGSAYTPLRSLTRFVCNGEFDFEIQLVLDKDEVPVCELGGSQADAELTEESAIGADALMPRLGWTSWAKTQPLAEHAGDTILRG